jgi:hypothetical protein
MEMVWALGCLADAQSVQVTVAESDRRRTEDRTQTRPHDSTTPCLLNGGGSLDGRRAPTCPPHV